MNNSPRLFVWGEDGIPGEFKAYVSSMGVGGGSWKYQLAGVVNITEKLRLSVKNDRQKFLENKEGLPKLSHHERSLVFMLHAYCAHHGQPVPSELLWLTFEALELREGEPAPVLEQVLGVPAGIDRMAEFFDASRLDGEADAGDRPLTVSALARLVSVSRDTIRRWRETPGYKSRRRMAAQAMRYWVGRSGGDEKV